MRRPNELTRRELIRYAALGGGAALLSPLVAACSSGGSSDASRSATSGSTGAEPTPGGTIRVGIGDASSFDSLDPALGFSFTSIVVTGAVFDNLVRLDENMMPQPGLASKWEANADSTEYLFTLRDGVTFHDGKSLTSADVLYSLQRLLDPKLGSFAYSTLSPVLDPHGVKADGPNAVRLKLKSADAFLPIKLGFYSERIVADGQTDFDNLPPGTGPFQVVSWTPGVGWEVKKNPSYWEDGLPYLDGMEGVDIVDQNTKVESVISGDIDVADQVLYTAISTLEQADGVEILRLKGSGYIPIACNQSFEPFKDVRVRQAFKMLVDREKFVELALAGAGDVTPDVPIPPQSQWFPSDITPWPHDPTEAKKLLTSAGYPNGLSLTMYTSPVTAGMEDTAIVFKEMAAEGDVTIDIQSSSSDVFFSKYWLQTPLCDAAWATLHPSMILPLVYGSGAANNESAFADAEFDQLVLSAQESTDLDEQKSLYSQACKILSDQSGEIIPAHIDRIWPHKTRVQGVELNWADTAQFRAAYVSS